MSVFYTFANTPTDDSELSDLYYEQLKTAHCYFCHRPMGLPAILWSGREVIFLHPACAKHLADGLMQDVQRVEDYQKGVDTKAVVHYADHCPECARGEQRVQVVRKKAV